MSKGIEIRLDSPPPVITGNTIVESGQSCRHITETVVATWWSSWHFAGFYLAVARLYREHTGEK